jgi:hypothetical protein
MIPIRRFARRWASATPAVRIAFMDIKALVATHGRDVRIDLFRGLANWFIFLDHIPQNVVNLITVRNFGFSGAADLFIFISGYAASIVYAKMTLERGFVIGASRIAKRVSQLYAAYVVLFVIDIIYEFNVAGLVEHPVRTLAYGLMLEARPLNLDVLQLTIVLMAAFPPVLWLMLRKPDLTMAGSVALYSAARAFDWNLRSFPDGDWYFNPFCWQLLFVFGAWLALGGTEKLRAILKAPILLYVGFAYLAFALVMTMAGRFAEFGAMFPAWLFDAFNPNDEVNLAPYRVLHLIVAALIVTRFVPKDWPGLEWPIFRPLIICGQQSLAVFCLGVFLSFAGHFALLLSFGSLLAQIAVSVSGIVIMTLAAYYLSWSRLQDAPSEIRHRMASIDAHF